jgi:hypothetical protein
VDPDLGWGEDESTGANLPMDDPVFSKLVRAQETQIAVHGSLIL